METDYLHIFHIHVNLIYFLTKLISFMMILYMRPPAQGGGGGGGVDISTHIYPPPCKLRLNENYVRPHNQK